MLVSKSEQLVKRTSQNVMILSAGWRLTQGRKGRLAGEVFKVRSEKAW